MVTFGFSSGNGDIHNHLFEITGNKLMLLEATNYFLQSEYLIRVFARDQLNSKSESSLIIIVDPPSGSDQFGILIGSNAPWPNDFHDTDGDGIDDRWQKEPFGPSERPDNFHALLTIIYGGKDSYVTTRKVVRGNYYPLRSTVYERGWKFKRWEGPAIKSPTQKFTTVLVTENQTVSAVYSRSLRGKYVNGYVVGATAFLDSAKNGSFNGIRDEYEPFAITDENGDFDLS